MATRQTTMGVPLRVKQKAVVMVLSRLVKNVTMGIPLMVMDVLPRVPLSLPVVMVMLMQVKNVTMQHGKQRWMLFLVQE